MKRLIKTLFIGVILGMLAISPALADLTSETYKTIFLPDGGTTAFDFDFKVFDEDDLEVILVLESTLAETTLVLGSGAGKYLVSDLSSSGGTVTTGTTYSTAYTLIVRRNQALKQEIDYVPRGPFSTAVLEQGLDQMVMMIQGQQEEIARAIKVGAIEISAPDYLATVAAGAAASVEAQEAAELAETNAVIAQEAAQAAQTAAEAINNTLIADDDADTKIQSEESTDDDIIRFDLGNATLSAAREVLTIQAIDANDVKIEPTTDSDVDLGSSSKYFKDAYIDEVYTPAIQFPSTAVPSADPNTQDDYEEGTFGGAGAGDILVMETSGTITCDTYGTMSYTKIGNIYLIRGTIEISAVSSPVGILKLLLPFTAAAGTQRSSRAGAGIVTHSVDLGGGTAPGIMVRDSTQYGELYAVLHDSAYTNIVPAVGGSYIFSFIYE